MADPDRRRSALELLDLDPSATQDEVADAIERLTRRAATLSTVSPERSIQLREQIRKARAALSASPTPVAEGAGVRAGADAATAPPPATPPATAPRPDEDRCPACHAPCGPADRFCTSCGTPRAAAASNGPVHTGPACTGCRAPVGVADRFCVACGTPVPTAPSAPLVAPPGAPLGEMRCAGCGRPSSPQDRFCTSCGTPRVHVSSCVACGAAMRDGDRFCTGCGAAAPAG